MRMRCKNETRQGVNLGIKEERETGLKVFKIGKGFISFQGKVQELGADE